MILQSLFDCGYLISMISKSFGGKMGDWLKKYECHMAAIRTVCSFLAMTLSIIILLKIFEII